MTTATRNAFIYGMTESIGETAIAYSLTAARWGVLAYDFFTSPEAKATYKWVGQMTIALGQLAFWSVVWAYAKVSAWAEAEVQSCLYIEDYEIDYQTDYGIPDDIWNSDPDHVADTDEADPFSPTENQHYPAMAQVITDPASVVVVKVEATAKQPTTAELRKRCIAHNQGLPMGDPRRIANAARLTKAQALKALGMV